MVKTVIGSALIQRGGNMSAVFSLHRLEQQRVPPRQFGAVIGRA
jgi:hypothetical protein